jgi:hypothetical protein
MDSMPKCQTIQVSCDYWNELLKHGEIASHAKRLALELECLLLSQDIAHVTQWYQSAHEALEQYRADVDRLYPQEHVSPLGKD